MRSRPDAELLDHLVTARLAGRVATPTSSSLTNCRRLLDGDPDCTFGLLDWRDATYEEVLAAVGALGGDLQYPDGGFIDPEAALEAILRHHQALAEFVAGGGGRVILATGHPGPLTAHYATLARALAVAGCDVLQPVTDSVDYLDGVGALAFDSGRHHTHRPDQMQAMLAEVDGVDLVIADHGFAGAAVEAGLPTLSIADVNDPALPLAQARGRTDGVLVIDDGLDPSVFVPVTKAMLSSWSRG